MAANAATAGGAARENGDSCSVTRWKCLGSIPCDRCRALRCACTSTSLRDTKGYPRKKVHYLPVSEGSAPAATAGGKGCGPIFERSTQQASYKARFPDVSISPGTEISGLLPSRFLDCFLRHFLPICRVADDRIIREGLVHAMANPQNAGVGSAAGDSLFESPEAKNGQALQCVLFSGLAIGGLLLGSPVEYVSRYLDAAGRCRERIRGLSDQTAMSALLLYGNAHAFEGSTESRVEYREAMDEAMLISDALPEEDPFVTSFVEYRRYMDNSHLLTMEVLSSHNPIKPLGWLMDTSRMVVKTEGARRVRTWIDKGRVVLAKRDEYCAHPAHVVEDCLFLATRYYNSVGEGSLGLSHVHDYLASELQRFVRVEAGSVVQATITGILIGVKTRLSRVDGLLPLAELIFSLFIECPGLARYDTRLAACRALAVFKLFVNCERYDALRSIVISGTDDHIPTFDDYRPGIPICSVEFVARQAEQIFMLTPRGGGGIGGDGSGSGGGGSCSGGGGASARCGGGSISMFAASLDAAPPLGTASGVEGVPHPSFGAGAPTHRPHLSIHKVEPPRTATTSPSINR